MILQVTALAFSPDGQHLASGSEDGGMMVWDLKDARRFAVTPNHKGPVWSLAFSQGDGSILASGMTAFTSNTCLCCSMCVLISAYLQPAVLRLAHTACLQQTILLRYCLPCASWASFSTGSCFWPAIILADIRGSVLFRALLPGFLCLAAMTTGVQLEYVQTAQQRLGLGVSFLD